MYLKQLELSWKKCEPFRLKYVDVFHMCWSEILMVLWILLFFIYSCEKALTWGISCHMSPGLPWIESKFKTTLYFPAPYHHLLKIKEWIMYFQDRNLWRFHYTLCLMFMFPSVMANASKIYLYHLIFCFLNKW